MSEPLAAKSSGGSDKSGKSGGSGGKGKGKHGLVCQAPTNYNRAANILDYGKET